MQLFRVPGLFHLIALLRSRILGCSTGPTLSKLGDEGRREIMEDSTGECVSQAWKWYMPLLCKFGLILLFRT